MTKHKSTRSLYDILSGRRGHDKARPAADGNSMPVIRGPADSSGKEPPSWVTKALSRSELESARAKATAPPLGSSARPIGSAAQASSARPVSSGVRPELSTVRPPSPIARPAAAASISRAPLVQDVRLTYLQLAVAAVGVVCACVICGYVGYRYGFGSGQVAGPVLPVTQKSPTADDIAKSPVVVGLVPPRPDGPLAPTGTRDLRPATPTATATGPVNIATPTSMARKAMTPTPTARPAPMPTPTEPERLTPVAPMPPAPTGPAYHVRIMTFGASQPREVDVLRGYLSQQGIDTELKLSGQSYVLYSQEQFADKTKSTALAAKINKALAEFGKLSRQKMPQDAFTEQVR